MFLESSPFTLEDTMGSVGFKRVIAIANLGYHFLIHLVKKPFLWHRRGLKNFLENYKRDGIVPLTLNDQHLLHRLSGCIHCGLCDTACPALLKFPREKFLGPSFIPGAFSRSFHHLEAADLDLSLCAECAECEKVCPNAVPIKEGMEFILQKSAEQRKLVG